MRSLRLSSRNSIRPKHLDFTDHRRCPCRSTDALWLPCRAPWRPVEIGKHSTGQPLFANHIARLELASGLRFPRGNEFKALNDMFDFLRKAEDVASRWFGSGHAAETSMDHSQQSQDRGLDGPMSSSVATPAYCGATDSMSFLFASYSDAPLAPQGSKNGEVGKQLQGSLAEPECSSLPGDVHTSRDIVAALATDDRSKAETAFRQAFLSLNKGPDSGKRFFQDLVAGTNKRPANRTDIVEMLISLRNSEARGGSEELFAAYDRVLQALAKSDPKLAVEAAAYDLIYKGNPDFRGTPIAVTEANESHATFVRRANEESVNRETNMAAEIDHEDRDKLQSANLSGPLFDQGVSYRDVKQGHLNDCFLVASMSAVAQKRPDIIRNSIGREETFPDGSLPPPGHQLYGVTFHKKGNDGTFRPVKIFVTSSIAARETGGLFGLFTHKQAAFASASNSDDLDQAEAWPLIYEKAYAKLIGSYRAFDQGGHGATALEEITGLPAREINPRKSSSEQTFQFIDEAMRSNQPMVANTIDFSGPQRADGRREHDLEDGLVSGHQYTVLGARRDGSTILVRVRNPWGKNGKYEGNGEQEITIEKFKQFFNGVTSAG